jgi:hypothetical protein
LFSFPFFFSHRYDLNMHGTGTTELRIFLNSIVTFSTRLNSCNNQTKPARVKQIQIADRRISLAYCSASRSQLQVKNSFLGNPTGRGQSMGVSYSR